MFIGRKFSFSVFLITALSWFKMSLKSSVILRLFSGAVTELLELILDALSESCRWGCEAVDPERPTAGTKSSPESSSQNPLSLLERRLCCCFLGLVLSLLDKMFSADSSVLSLLKFSLEINKPSNWSTPLFPLSSNIKVLSLNRPCFAIWFRGFLSLPFGIPSIPSLQLLQAAVSRLFCVSCVVVILGRVRVSEVASPETDCLLPSTFPFLIRALSVATSVCILSNFSPKANILLSLRYLNAAVYFKDVAAAFRS